jgi:tryptophanyl-tRNA synthetase
MNYSQIKLVEQFGCEPLNSSDISRLYSLTANNSYKLLDHLHQNNLLISHRDINDLMNAYEKGEKFYIYTGRGPSSGSLHVGHLIPFIIAKHLQEIFDAPVFIQLSTDEKYMRDELSLEEVEKMAYNNAVDIMSIGFNPMKTIILSNFKCIQQLYPVTMDILRHTTINQMIGIFGMKDGDNAGNYYFPAVEAAPAFPSALKGIIEGYSRCLVVLGIDQDPYFRLARDVARNLKCHKPALLHTTFVPALTSVNSKMSSSDPSTAIFLSDNIKQIVTKINKRAFSGGQNTIKLHHELGANINIDVSCRYLQIFSKLSLNDIPVEDIITKYRKGLILSAELKKIVITLLCEIISRFRENRLGDYDMQNVMTIRKIA